MFERVKNLVVTSLIGGLTLFVISWFALASKPVNSREARLERERLEKRSIVTQTFTFTDTTRNREIPYVLYHRVKVDTTKPIRLVVFSHGYGKNYEKNYLGYTYITQHLARRGYWVISIQHELATDDPLPRGENLYELRYPIWIRGMKSIRATIAHFSWLNPDIEISTIDLVGHSNGGDMSVMAALKYPSEFRKVVTLDNLRCPFPLQKYPEVLTLRSSDKTADEGVIPEKAIADSIGLKVVQLKKVGHNDMNDYASKAQKKQIMRHVDRFLN